MTLTDEADQIWLSRKEATTHLKRHGFPIATQTLANFAVRGNEEKGPPIRRFGRAVQYRRDLLEAWARERTTGI